MGTVGTRASTTLCTGATLNVTTCCIGVLCEGTETSTTLCTGAILSVTTFCIGGDGILISMTLYGVGAFSETTFCMGGNRIRTFWTFCMGAALSSVICSIVGDGIVHSTIWFGLKADGFLTILTALVYIAPSLISETRITSSLPHETRNRQFSIHKN